MPTTTIRLPVELKARVAKAAKRTGTTTHGFILEAIAARTEAEERRSEFLDEAEQRWQQFLGDGKAIGWNDMREYLLRQARGENAPRPRTRVPGGKP